MSAGESYANSVEGVKQYQQKLNEDAIGGYDEMVANITSQYNDTLTKYQEKWSSLQDAGIDDLMGMAGSKALITGGYKLYKNINKWRKPNAPDGTKVPERPPGEGGTTSGTATTEDASAGFDAGAFDDFAAKNLARFGGSEDTGGGLEDVGFSEKDAGDLFGEGGEGEIVDGFKTALQEQQANDFVARFNNLDPAAQSKVKSDYLTDPEYNAAASTQDEMLANQATMDKHLTAAEPDPIGGPEPVTMGGGGGSAAPDGGSAVVDDGAAPRTGILDRVDTLLERDRGEGEAGAGSDVSPLDDSPFPEVDTSGNRIGGDGDAPAVVDDAPAPRTGLLDRVDDLLERDRNLAPDGGSADSGGSSNLTAEAPAPDPTPDPTPAPDPVPFEERNVGQIQPASSDPAPPPEAPPSKPPDIDTSYDAPESSRDLPSDFQGGGELRDVGSGGGGPEQPVPDQLTPPKTTSVTPEDAGADLDDAGTSLFDDAKSGLSKLFADTSFEDVAALGEVGGSIAGLVMVADAVDHLFNPPKSPTAPKPQMTFEPLQQTTAKYSQGLVSTDSAQDRAGSGMF